MGEIRRKDYDLQVYLPNLIPKFWDELAGVWFRHVEGVWADRELSDLEKYNLVIGKLEMEVLQRVSNVLFNPPAEGKYDMLKSTLLSIYESQARKVQRLVEYQKPSQLLRELRVLTDSKVGDDILSVLWMSYLPAAVRDTLLAVNNKELNVLSTIADELTALN